MQQKLAKPERSKHKKSEYTGTSKISFNRRERERTPVFPLRMTFYHNHSLSLATASFGLLSYSLELHLFHFTPGYCAFHF